MTDGNQYAAAGFKRPPMAGNVTGPMPYVQPANALAGRTDDPAGTLSAHGTNDPLTKQGGLSQLKSLRWGQNSEWRRSLF
jgi:hypothetical protein